ncbi:hypothetical protein N177_3738 [Lutibaculum baratangense AMV1]|uniref:Uncharacterized protein n=1 Tax=Lutibaculum baratangense AMV1 TaxID=631454 RepID=V4QS58_9HYPH|nr:hypothetical protein N177_3738 [Lutibaculum baratangense AMV1]
MVCGARSRTERQRADLVRAPVPPEASRRRDGAGLSKSRGSEEACATLAFSGRGGIR